MLFSREPKESLRELYDREEEVALLKKSLEAGEGLIIVYGVRRAGKTSLIKAVLNDLKLPYAYLNLWLLAEKPSLLKPAAIGALVEKVLQQYMTCGEKFRSYVSTASKIIDELEFKEFSLKLRKHDKLFGLEKTFVKIIGEADRWACKHSTRFIVVFDEAQELRGSPLWLKILAGVLDSYRNISFIIAGSEIGVLRDFLRLEDPRSPLYGRTLLEIRVERFDRETALSFLKAGFEEAKIKVDERELQDTVSTLDGIVGWLSLYGYLRVTYGLGHQEALARIADSAANLMAVELEKLVKYSPRRYLGVLKAISLGADTWSSIKRLAEALLGEEIKDVKLTRILSHLIKYGFLEKIDGRYRLVDNLSARAVEVLAERYRVRLV